MSALAAQQRAMAAAIVDGDSPGALLRPTSNGQASRLHIYREAYGTRLREALKSNYPVLYQVLGDDAFAELSQGYVQAHPSQRPSIRWFGHRLEAFMQAHPELCPHPSLADLAAMEWALRDAFDAADAAPLGIDDLIALSPDAWPGLRFTPHPSLALLPLGWAVEPLWKALSADADASTEAPEPHPHVLLVWRDGLDTRWRALSAEEALLLTACTEGRSFAGLGALAEQQFTDEPATRLAGLLRLWVGSGLLMACAA